MKSFIIENEQRKIYLCNLIKEQPVDGSVTVEFKKTVTASTAAQRRLKWMWNDEIAGSGLGRYDTSKDVHIWNKMKFGHPIKMRDAIEADGDFYPELYTAFVETYKNHPAYPRMVKFFADDHIKTEKFTRKQNAEYLTNVQRYWTGKGLALTDPSMQGLDEWLGYKPKKENTDGTPDK